jgi:hypothetical protein
MYSGEADAITPPWHAHLIAAHVPDKAKVVHHVVEHAGHLSFLSELPRAAWEDPPGFDRVGFHEKLGRDVCAFLDRALQR